MYVLCTGLAQQVPASFLISDSFVLPSPGRGALVILTTAVTSFFYESKSNPYESDVRQNVEHMCLGNEGFANCELCETRIEGSLRLTQDST
jgi:hypothetical protein